jgi:hypothetical protein
VAGARGRTCLQPACNLPGCGTRGRGRYSQERKPLVKLAPLYPFVAPSTIHHPPHTKYIHRAGMHAVVRRNPPLLYTLLYTSTVYAILPQTPDSDSDSNSRRTPPASCQCHLSCVCLFSCVLTDQPTNQPTNQPPAMVDRLARLTVSSALLCWCTSSTIILGTSTVADGQPR